MNPASPNVSANNVLERPQWWVKSFVNSAAVAGFQLLGSEQQITTDAPFRMVGLAVFLFAEDGSALGAAGNVNATLRFTRPDGSWVQKHITSAELLNPYDAGAILGAGGLTPPYYGYFSPLGTNILFPAGAAIQIDFAVAAGVTYSKALIVFIGTKLFNAGLVWAPSYPPKYNARPYFGYDLQIDLTTLPLRDVPFPVPARAALSGAALNADADFVWQSGTQTDQPGPGAAVLPVGTRTRGVGVKFKDWSGKYYMNDYVPLELIFGFDNSQTPGLLYPEIYIPKNQQLYFDFANL